MKYYVVFDGFGYAVGTWSEQEYEEDFGHLQSFHPERKEFENKEVADQFRLEHNEKKLQERNMMP